jgi:hypothetical protein
MKMVLWSGSASVSLRLLGILLLVQLVPDSLCASIWPSTATPVLADGGADSSVEVGVKFRSDTNGTITAIRFYKSTANTGAHVGNLWSSSGTLLGTATFSGETASGWQQANFTTPIPISSNTVYVASYHCNGGHYGSDLNFFASAGVDNPPLHALSSGASGGNGVYAYGSASAFPTSTYNAANYWVDVVFVPGPLPLVINTSSLPEAVKSTAYSTTLSASGGATPYTWSLATGTLPAGLTLAAGSGTISGTPTTTGTSTFTVKVTDASSPAQAVTKQLTITVSATASAISIWPATAAPAQVDAGADSSVELGVKFKSDVAGTITGIRFFKSSGNTGTHTANLWSSSGNLLVSAPFTAETGSGWQQVTFLTAVSISANTVYIASYHCNTGHYSDDLNYFTVGVDNPPLHALANGVSGPNGVYAYGSGSTFPNQTWNAGNYWVDVLFRPGTVATLSSISVTPANPQITQGGTQQFTATGTYSDGTTQNITSSVTWTSNNGAVTINATGLGTAVSAGTATIKAALGAISGTTIVTVVPAPLAILTAALPNAVPLQAYTTTLAATGGTTPYSWSIVSGALPSGLTLAPATGIISGTPTLAGTYSMTIQVKESSKDKLTVARAFTLFVTSAPQFPILVVTDPANPFTQYYSEILLAEGLNSYAVQDLSGLTSTKLAGYHVVLLGQTVLTAAQVTMFTDWVNAGGNLIAFRPDKKLAPLLGLTDAGSTLSDGYLLTIPEGGIVNQTIQFHGTADRYTLSTASAVATLYSNATTATANPAVTVRNVGSNGGQAVAFAFDLARSVVYTRQGNPNWAGQERDGFAPIRSDDLFYGAASFDPQANYVDLNKVAIPQADEQQRLLANLIIYVEGDKRLLPRFWYFPNGHKAAVVMTGDDHAIGGTVGRFNQYMSLSPANGSVSDWETIRATSYIYPGTPISDAQAKAFQDAGFEIALHLNTACLNVTASSLASMLSTQLGQFKSAYPSLASSATLRIHCLVWSDYSIVPEAEKNQGIRLDTTYYYWPPGWVGNRPGMFTGSGIPMRFASAQGNLIDVYQAPTQMTDESGQAYPFTSDTLLDRALGAEGYYGAFVANMHTDEAASQGSDAILASAISRGVPVISAKQLLTWLDARNASTIQYVDLVSGKETFTIQANPAAKGLLTMVPIPAGSIVSNVKFNGASIAFSTDLIKGVNYAFFPANTGSYEVTYVADTTAPLITGTSPVAGQTGVNPGTAVTVTFNESMLASSVSSSTFSLRDSLGAIIPSTVTYDASSLTAILEPNNYLLLNKVYTARATGGASGLKDVSGNALAADLNWSFTTATAYSLWDNAAVPAILDAGADSPVELGVKFQSEIAGTITGIRFYKSAGNTGTHVANLWSSGGTLLATATFGSETSSGWQQVNFAAPVPIAANTIYIASYHSNNGHYSINSGYFSTGLDNPPLHAPASGTNANGVYQYGATSLFPNQSFNAANYWVDPVFK